MTSGIVFFLLFVLPFVIAPFGITQFENPKVLVAEVAIIILFLFSFFRVAIPFHNKTTQLVVYGSIFLVTIIDMLFFRTSLSFFGNAFRMQGVFLLWFLLLFSFLSSRATFYRVPWWIFFVILFAEVVVTFFLPLNASQRYVGTLGEPNALAAFVVFIFPFVWLGTRYNRFWEIAGKIVLLLLMSTMLYVSGSRSGMIAFGIEIIFLLLQRLHVATKQCVVTCLCLYVLVYSLPFFVYVPYENRVEIWQSALFAGSTSPIFGHGFGNTEFALHSAAVHLNLPIQYYYVDSSHNIFLDWWVQGGIVGIGLLLFLVIYAFHAFFQQNRTRDVLLLLGMITMLSFNPASVVGLLSFWWIIGQGLRNHQNQNKRNSYP